MLRLIALVLLLLPYGLTAQSYEIRGEVAGLSADSLVILKIVDGYSIEKIAVEGTRFSYEDEIREPYFVQLLLVDPATNQTSGKLAEFMVEAGTIFVEGPAAEYDSIRVRGSESNQVLEAYFAEDNALSERWDSLKTKYDTYQAAGDTLARKQAARQLNYITLEERVPLLKQYVTQYRDQVIGALLPNFCTLQEVLKPEDYAEMYELLTPEIRETDYGRSVLERSKPSAAE